MSTRLLTFGRRSVVVSYLERLCSGEEGAFFQYSAIIADDRNIALDLPYSVGGSKNKMELRLRSRG